MRRASSFTVSLVFGGFTLCAATVAAQTINGPIVSQEAFRGESIALTDLAAAAAAAPESFSGGAKFELNNPYVNLRSVTKGPGFSFRRAPTDRTDPAVIQKLHGSDGTTPAPNVSFEGTSDDDNAALLGFRIVPPDTNGDVGHVYFAQMNNLVFEIFDKATGASVLGPLPNNIFYAGQPTFCNIFNDGDPVVLYDHQARRWIFSQFAWGTPEGRQCFAVSKTSDPLGEYWLYSFVMTTPGAFAVNDYPKLGLWTDGIYYTANDFTPSLTTVSAFALDKEAMYAGQPATSIGFTLPFIDGDVINYSLLPSHWEGDIKPTKGTPNTFIQMWDSEQFSFSGGGPDGVKLWDFYADFDSPADSEFVPRGVVELFEYESFVCPSRNCVDQPDPGLTALGNGLDAIDFHLMHKAQYRNFGNYASLVFSGTVSADGSQLGTAGVLWGELRSSKGGPWTHHQSSIFAPDDGEERFMPSIAQNKNGEIALGYTVSSVGTYPSVRYTTRQEGDPLGTMTGGEVACHDGTGSQVSSANRWGDYSSMSVDPQSDCTFWYTNEYYEDNGSFDFKTRICSFDTCGK